MSGANRSRGPALALVNPMPMEIACAMLRSGSAERVLKHAEFRAARPAGMPGGNQSFPAHHATVVIDKVSKE